MGISNAAMWAVFAFGLIALLGSMPYFWKANKTHGSESYGWSITALIYLAFAFASGLVFIGMIYFDWMCQPNSSPDRIERMMLSMASIGGIAVIAILCVYTALLIFAKRETSQPVATKSE